MNASLKNVFAITMFVEDPKRSKAFYLDVFDVKVIGEDDTSVAFGFENVIVNLVTKSSAQEMIDPGKVASEDAGSQFQLTVLVHNVDAVCAELAARNITLLNGPIDRYWGMRTALFTDPDGYLWEIAQQIGSSGGSTQLDDGDAER